MGLVIIGDEVSLDRNDRQTRSDQLMIIAVVFTRHDFFLFESFAYFEIVSKLTELIWYVNRSYFSIYC